MDATILQNPSDPEATYREKAGQSSNVIEKQKSFNCYSVSEME